MTARLNDRELDRVLDAWLSEGPATVSGAALAGALERIPVTRQRRLSGRWLGPLAELRQAERWRPAIRVAGILVVLAALAGVVALAALIGAPPGPDPSPTPATTSPSVDADVSQAPSSTPQSSPPASVELQLDGSPLAADQWEFKGCPPVTITEPDGERVCRFTDGWHRLEIYGLSQPGLDGAGIATSDSGVRVRIWWYRGEIGDTLHLGDFESTQGECRLNLTDLTDTLANGTIDCTAVPGAYSTTVGGTEQETKVDLRGSFTFNPSTGAIEGF
jgi:hypothetical protein